MRDSGYAMSFSCEPFHSPVGILHISFKGKSLAGISINERPPGIKLGRTPKEITRQIRAYFNGSLREFTLPFVLDAGTEFEKRVWLALKEIPYGQTRTYKWLSEIVGRPGASRAVGQALSKNPLPIILPCHRVIESGGRLGGYSPDVNIKRRLLEMEYYHSARADSTLRDSLSS